MRHWEALSGIWASGWVRAYEWCYEQVAIRVPQSSCPSARLLLFNVSIWSEAIITWHALSTWRVFKASCACVFGVFGDLLKHQLSSSEACFTKTCCCRWPNQTGIFLFLFITFPLSLSLLACEYARACVCVSMRVCARESFLISWTHNRPIKCLTDHSSCRCLCLA